MSDWLSEFFPDVAERLTYRITGGRIAVANCPGPMHKNGDRHPSLLLKRGDSGGLVFCCMCGDSKPSILSAMGLSWRNVCEDKDRKRIPPVLMKTYQYRSPDGTDAFQVQRFHPKRFSPRRRLPQCQNEWVYNVTGGPIHRVSDYEGGYKWIGVDGKRLGDPCGPGEVAAPVLHPWPYNADMIAATNNLICWAEGEKCADYLAILGFLTTTTHGGSGGRFFDKTWVKLFKDRHVVILPDHDEPGRNYARHYAGALLDARAASVGILHLPGQADKNGADDWAFRQKKDEADVGPNSTAAKELRKLIAKSGSYGRKTLKELFA